MFFFNKTNAVPRSRQSSLDSNVNDPVSPRSEFSAYEGAPSPERRERGPYGKRSSVFTLRSRSNTATSAASSFLSRASTMTGTETSSHRSSQDIGSITGSQTSLSEMGGQKRSLFSRGKRLRRQSSQVSSAPTLDEIEEVDAGKRPSVLRKDRNKRGVDSNRGSIQDLKPRISSPFDFQHLTHTHRQQFPALDRTTQNELVAEFWAVRASQVPRRELHGIKAEDLHFQSLSSKAVNATNPAERSSSALSMSRTPPPLSPHRSRDLVLPDSPSPVSSVQGLRHSRSVESFSQPVVKGRSHRFSQSVNPPPRVSSRLALTRIDDFTEEQPSANGYFSVPTRSRYSKGSGAYGRSSPPSRPSTAGSLSTVMADPSFIAQAVTTPDDTAITALSPGFSSDLENVPEEPERFFNPRPAPRPPLKSPVEFTFRQLQRSPTVVRSASRTSSYSTTRSFSQRSSKQRPTSQMSDTLGAPIQCRPGRNSIRHSQSTKRQSALWKNVDTSWEDDIDYCYEHAAEADCEFDWDRGSVECDDDDGDDDDEDTDDTAQQQDYRITEASQYKDTTVGTYEDAPFQTRFFPGTFRTSLIVPSTNTTPELDHRSALSSSTDAGALTPSDVFSSPPVHDSTRTSFTDAECFSLTPSLLVPQDFKYQVMRDEMYEELLADYETSDRHYPLLDPAQSVAGSSRSSRTRLSKRSSYDSSLVSGSVSSPIRRSASSSGSLPELVHSRRVRKTFDMMVEQLTEQVASIAHLDEDQEEPDEVADGDAPTRPSATTGHTFFAIDDEQHHDTHLHSNFEQILPEHETNSQSQPPPTPTPAAAAHHERAASDSAAKLLAGVAQSIPAASPPAKSWKRAANSGTTLRSSKQAYTLSLFPAPPRPRKATA
ncbi:hypothetical protein K432DRAFT_391019 [Lepidopterella palustris CBS 459.81]|uniref:CRIB domain-containing protein n=1 Tax=Lepidopterella palustris CBS 459.81 TaxID=1314670 RepID=A0A8E2EET0_9PEZI|nr:hypothetical protein K432DRAFT_391019 [Lepidopterella palustris CBS 459.81]